MTPPDARTVNPGQPVTYHASGGTAITDDLTARILAVLASPAGREAIAAALRHPLVGRQCRLLDWSGHGPGENRVTVIAVEPTGVLRVRSADWPAYIDFRVAPDDVEWIS